MKKINIGIDTSCYTTSLVAIDENNTIIYADRKLLKVKEGTVGLRQSDAFFQHVHHLPELFEDMMLHVDKEEIVNMTVSSKPRPLEDSYMPVFTAGLSFAKVISDVLKVPLYQISHQENHLYAAAFNHRLPKVFIGVHISGGTSEILKVKRNSGFEIKIVGETLDLSFGQLIDRIGVHMDLPFPCGKHLDALAIEQKVYPLKMSIKDDGFNISGIENQLKKAFDTDQNASKVAYSLFYYLSQLLIKMIDQTFNQYGINDVVMSGGVSANRIIRQSLQEYFGSKVIFTDVEYATDHAIGNAYYGKVVMSY